MTIAVHSLSMESRRGCGLPVLLLLVLSAVVPIGCTSPPSVVPLLHVGMTAMAREAQHQAEDAQRDALLVQQQLQALEDAFDADLAWAQREQMLDAPWVQSATRGYTLAREELLRHEHRVREQRRQRADNLQAAAEAQQRAIILLQHQDRLLLETLRFDLWGGGRSDE